MGLLTVNQVAKLLGVHEKTIRRYINNGRLVAKKIGGQWRIEREAYEQLINRGSCCSRDLESEEIGGDDFCVFMDSDFFASNEKVQICSIIDYFTEDLNEVEMILERFKSIAYDYLVKGHQVKIEDYYSLDEKKARYVIWATPNQIAAFNSIIESMGK